MAVSSFRLDDPETSDSWFAVDRPLASNPSQLRDAYVGDGEPLSWSDAVDVFRADHGPEARFGRRWASGLWRRWLDRDRTLAQQTQTTLMLSLTASPWLTDEYLLPPTNHLRALEDGRNTVLSALRDCLNVGYRIGWVWGAHRSGYAHCHIGVWCFDRTDPLAVEPALSTYVDALPLADRDEHGTGAITAYHGDDLLADRTSTSERAPATRLGAYLANNVPGSGSQPREGIGVKNELGAGDAHRIRLATVLDATSTEAYSRPDR